MLPYFRLNVRVSSQISRRTFASTARIMASKAEWLIILPDNEGALEKRMEVRPKHLEAVKPNASAGVINMGGALLDDPFKEGEAMKINGSAMLITAETKEDAMKIIESDIYYKSGVWDPKKIQVYPFKTAVRNSL